VSWESHTREKHQHLPTVNTGLKGVQVDEGSRRASSSRRFTRSASFVTMLERSHRDTHQHTTIGL
jgi:uncharacterized membrane-anchored protein YhcB (DUF1043 family)